MSASARDTAGARAAPGGGAAVAPAAAPSRRGPAVAAFVPFRDRLLHAALARALRGCASVLDVGCGPSSPLARAGYRGLAIGIDLSSHELGQAKRAAFHTALVRANVERLADFVRPHSVDAVVALDLIEHLPREHAVGLLDAFERTARRKVVVLTPNGFVPQPGTPENPFQEHRCGFTTADLRARGYLVRGILGPRFLFGPFGDVRLRPGVLWRRVADLTAPLVYPLPRAAFALLATKDVQARD